MQRCAVFRQGDASDSCYIILEGSVSVWVDNSQLDMQYPVNAIERRTPRRPVDAPSLLPSPPALPVTSAGAVSPRLGHRVITLSVGDAGEPDVSASAREASGDGVSGGTPSPSNSQASGASFDFNRESLVLQLEKLRQFQRTKDSFLSGGGGATPRDSVLSSSSGPDSGRRSATARGRPSLAQERRSFVFPQPSTQRGSVFRGSIVQQASPFARGSLAAPRTSLMRGSVLQMRVEDDDEDMDEQTPVLPSTMQDRGRRARDPAAG
jgi:hypothetical protein